MPDLRSPQIFISWSLDLSREIAVALQKWLCHVFPEIRSFMSHQDIDAGTLPMPRVKEELASASCGILVITAANQERQWINFEAGSLYKELGSSVERVIPLLVDLKAGDLRGPLGLLQFIELSPENMIHKLIPSLCHAFQVEVGTRQENGAAFLERFMGAVDSARDIAQSEPPIAAELVLDVPGMVAEILDTVRALARSFGPSDSHVWRSADLTLTPDLAFLLAMKHRLRGESETWSSRTGESWLAADLQRRVEEGDAQTQ